jgi:hypothetical protein
MGAYAFIAGIQIGTIGEIGRLRDGSLIWIFAVCMAGWIIYFAAGPGLFKKPTFDSVNTVPAGVVICFAAAILSRLCLSGDYNK